MPYIFMPGFSPILDKMLWCLKSSCFLVFLLSYDHLSWKYTNTNGKSSLVVLLTGISCWQADCCGVSHLTLQSPHFSNIRCLYLVSLISFFPCLYHAHAFLLGLSTFQASCYSALGHYCGPTFHYFSSILTNFLCSIFNLSFTTYFLTLDVVSCTGMTLIVHVPFFTLPIFSFI